MYITFKVTNSVTHDSVYVATTMRAISKRLEAIESNKKAYSCYKYGAGKDLLAVAISIKEFEYWLKEQNLKSQKDAYCVLVDQTYDMEAYDPMITLVTTDWKLASEEFKRCIKDFRADGVHDGWVEDTDGVWSYIANEEGRYIENHFNVQIIPTKLK